MQPPLRLLLLTETFSPEVGGGERQARMLSQALARRGHQVTILTRRSQPRTTREEIDGGVRVVRIGPVGPGRWKKWALAIAALWPLVRIARDADVIVVSGYRILGVPAVVVARLLGCACVLKADSSGEMSGEFFRAGLAALRLEPTAAGIRLIVRARNALLRKADAFVAMSHEITAELLAAGVTADRIYPVPNGVDTAAFRPASAVERAALRQRLGIPGGPIVIYTGRLVSYKGLPLLLRVWCGLRRSGVPGTLLLVGAGGADMHNCEADLRDYVATHTLQDSVIFTGAVDNIEEYLRASDVFVFPTENEAFGVSLIEAMACGLPAVATSVGGITDYLLDGVNGLVVEPGRVAPLYEAIRMALGGGARLAELGQAARDTVVARFSADAVADRYLRLFQSLGLRVA